MFPPTTVTGAIRLVRHAPPLWPGFEPRGTPLLVFDGVTTWLDGAVPQDSGWTPAGSLWRWPGQHPALTANTAVTLPGGTVTAGVRLPLLGAVGARTLASVIVHEAFHVFQQRCPSPAWEADEFAALTYPATDPEILHARAEETRALADALAAADWIPHARRALHWRRVRLERLAPEHQTVEARMETLEGLAEYVETRFLGTVPTLDTVDAARMTARQWAYHSGAALAHLLDRGEMEWTSRVLESTPLHDLLAGVVGPASPPPRPTPGLRNAAQAAVHAHAASLGALEAAFHGQPGRRLTVTSGFGLPVTGLDPMNLTPLTGGRFLHTRVLTLNLGGNATFRISGGSALTHGPGLWRPTTVEVRALPEPTVSGGTWRVRDGHRDIAIPLQHVHTAEGGWIAALA